ncbi:MAG: thiamine pyrophosphate-binding protein [Opitutales bacterium]|nr:thiamine pyrophosphate-binding protein [Opitutales bacterium]
MPRRCILEIKNARKPILLAGGGIRAACCTDVFECFVKKTGIPVVTTLNGIDAIDEAYGFSGLNGHPCCNRALREADLLLALGVRFRQRQIGKSIEGYTNAKIIRVEIDDSEIGRSFIKEDLVIRADLKVFFEHINTYAFNTDFSDWHRQLTDWKVKSQNDVCSPVNTTNPVTFVREMQQYYQDDTIVTTNVGANQMWVAQGYQQKNRQRFLTSSGLGIMGFSLPAAIGASYLAKNAVIAYTGDGCLQMNLQELNTLAVRRNNIKCVVFNNNTLGLVRSMQNKRFGARHYGTTPTAFTCPDLHKLADCFRLKYVNIRNREDFPKLKNVFADTEPWIVEIRVDTDSEPFSRGNEPSWHGV